MPNAIIVDNGAQFNSEAFKTFCDQIGMKIHFASVRHPESNGLVERANGIIITGIMKSIFNLPKGKWLDKLVKVVWNHNTVVSRSTGFTPFKLLFGDEAITLEEAKIGSIMLGVCFVAEDPKGRKHLRQILLETAPKLSSVKLRHNDRSQDEGVNRLKDKMT